MTNKELVTAWFAAYDNKDYSGMKNMLASNHSFKHPMAPVPLDSEGHMGMVQGMSAAFTGGHKVNKLFADGDYVIADVTWMGKHTGDFNGIPASGKDVSLPLIDIFHIQDGKIVEDHIEFNGVTIMMQIGAMPVPAEA